MQRGEDYPDYANLDLAATKTLGKWEVGAVGFGSWDVSTVRMIGSIASRVNSPSAASLATTSRASALQAYMTRDVWTDNYFNPSETFRLLRQSA